MKPFNNTRIASATIAGIEFQQNEAGQFKLFLAGKEITDTDERIHLIRTVARKTGLKIEGVAGMVLVAKIIKAANA